MAYNFYQQNQKYNNKKIEYDGIVFDSKREMKRYSELKVMLQANEISDLQMQVKFVLIPTQYYTIEKVLKSGKIKQEQRVAERECAYIADFVYKDKQGNIVVEDTKGFRTKDYTIKRKLMLYIHHIKIVEL